MAVQVATLDILTERAHFDPEVARAIGDAIDMELKTSRETLATKQDISDLRQATKQDITDLEQAMRQDISDLRQETKQDINQLRHEVKRDISELKHATSHDISNLRQDMKDIKLSLSQEYAKGREDLTRWMLAITLMMVSFMLGLAYFMVQHVH